jgi:hypothetical protein
LAHPPAFEVPLRGVDRLTVANDAVGVGDRHELKRHVVERSLG